MNRTALVSSAITAALLSTSVIARDISPPSADRPWSPPRLNNYQAELANPKFGDRKAPPIAISPDKIYDLPELIDIAQRSNPETRAAWERARMAAAAVGLSQSAYFPYLAASAASGYERAFIPFPTLKVNQSQLVAQIDRALADPQAAIGRLESGRITAPNVSIDGGGTLTTEAAATRAAISLKWLLLDFGGRAADVAAARERLMMANVGFNGTHQRVVFEVTRRFYEFNAARAKTASAESTKRASNIVAEAARARLSNGLATKPEVLQAEQQAALATFNLEATRGALSDSLIELVQSLGIPPTTELRIAGVPEDVTSQKLESSVDALIDRALSQRPDLVAGLAKVRACRAEVRKARSEFYPKVAIDAHAGWSELDVSVDQSPYFGGNEPVFGAFLAVELPIFDGFARDKKLKIAEAELRKAEDELAMARDAAVRDVWKSYTDFETALRKQIPAGKLLEAAESAAAATLDAYEHGLGSYVEVANAQSNLTTARNLCVETRSTIFTSAAALALSVGDLAKSPSPSNVRRKRK